MKIGFLPIAMVLLNILLAQTAHPVDRDSLVDRARKGDDSALQEMEQAGNVQALKSLLHDPSYAGKFAVRLSLGRMGDIESLQYFACRSFTDDVNKMQLLLRNDYDHIGGAFTVQIYRRLLDSDPQFIAFVKRNTKHRYSDVIVTLPSTMVLQYLSKLLPKANIPNPPPDDPSQEGTKLKWRSWIDEHKDEIQSMPPSTEGINFSSSFCAKTRRAPEQPQITDTGRGSASLSWQVLYE